MRDIKRFFSYMGKYKLRYWTILIITLIIESSLQILYSYVTKESLNAIEYNNMQLFCVAAFLCVIIVILKCLFPYLRYLQIRLVRKMVYEFKLRLFDKLLHMDMRFFGNTHSAAVLKTLNPDANSLKDSWFSHVYWVLGKTVLVVSGISTMYFYSPILTGISLIISALTVFISIKINQAIKNIAKKVQRKTSKLTTLVSDIISGFIILKMNSGSSLVLKHFREENEAAASEEKGRVRMVATLEMASFLLGIIGSFGTIIVGALLVSKGDMDYGTVMAVVTLQASVSNSMQRFGGSLSAFTTSVVRASNVFNFMELNQEEPVQLGDGIQLDEGSVNQKTNSIGDAIRISQVQFSYEDNGDFANVLDSTIKQRMVSYNNMVIKSGEKIMLVGESGCGKSTLLKLLLGFYPIDSGKIELFGKNINEYSLEHLRRIITYVPQDSYLFEGTIEENILYGWNKETPPDKESIVTAAKQAFAHDFIKSFPDGYQTRLISGGNNLSGGQRQRIAIARALMKESEIILMDEPSSALDTHSENVVLKAMEHFMKDKTVIYVSHRMTGMEKFDRVISI